MSKLFAAFGEAELPCPIGTPIVGWIPPERPTRMKLDPLLANLAILKNRENVLVLISLDLLSLDIRLIQPRSFMQRAPSIHRLG